MTILINSVRFRLSAGIIVLTALLLAALGFVLHFELRTDLEAQSFKAVESSGNRITGALLQQLAKAQTLSNNIANYAATAHYNEAEFKKIIYAIIDLPGTEGLIAGGGFWPEPNAFDSTRERASLFWGRDQESGKLIFYNDYNDANTPGYHHEEWYEPARYLKPGQCYWSRSYIDAYSNQPMVTCTTAIFKQGEFVGASTIDVKLEGLGKLLLEQTQNTGGYAFIVDQNNTFISFPTSKLAFKKIFTNRLEARTADEFAQFNIRFEAIARELKQTRSELLVEATQQRSFNSKVTESLKLSYQINADQAAQIQVSLLDPLHDLPLGKLLLSKLQLANAPMINEAVNVSIYHMPQTYWKLVFVTPVSRDVAVITGILKDTLVYLCIPVIILLIAYWTLLESSVLRPLKKITAHIRDSDTNNAHQPLELDKHTPKELIELIRWYNKRSTDLNLALNQLSNVNVELSHLAHHDSLTGLANRRGFETRLQELAESSIWNHYALLMMDIDQFKVINDTAGHMAGDRLLATVADIIRKQLRNDDYFARLGGDEFSVLLHVEDIESAYQSAERVRIAIEEYRQIEGKQVFDVTTSIGLAHLSGITPPDAIEAMRHVDKACHVAKDRGRNRVQVYSASDEEMSKREGELNWLSEINQALDEDRIIIELQRMKPLNSDDPSRQSAEVLARMKDQQGKTIPPGAFLPAAERYGLAGKIDSRVAELALKTIAENPLLEARMDYISINLSSDSMQNEHLADDFLAMIKRYNVPTQIICLEITETGVIRYLDIARSQLEKLRSAGVRIALDDFGSGMSSYGYLRDLPVDIIKIDGSFVRNLDTDPINRAFVQSMQDVATVMQLKTVAEFVENQSVEQHLKQIGVNYAQGYGIAKPALPIELLNHLLWESSNGQIVGISDETTRH